MGNGRVARDLAPLQGGRREKILYGEQCSGSGKDRQLGGLFSGGRLAALLLSHGALWLRSFSRLASRPPEKQRARSPFCYRLLLPMANKIAIIQA
jgi:hypothetical protein